MSRLFLGIGAQKAGTSWLYRCLLLHPEVWLPPVKELHFFDERMKRGTLCLPPRIRTPRARLELRELVADLLRRRDPNALAWGWRYFLPERDIVWYRSILSHPSRPLAGDITPAYATLDDAAVEMLAAELPGVRAILLLRNPLERAYSHAVMDLTRSGRRDGRSLQDGELIAHFRSPASRARGAYLDIIGRWEERLGRSRLFVGFYDEIAEAPAALLTRIAAFLGIRTLEWPAATVVRRVNVTRRGGIPEQPRAVLAELYQDEVAALARRYGRYPARWLTAWPQSS